MSTQSREPGLKSLAANVKQSVSLSIVAVRLRHSSNLQRYVTTLALLDNGSQGTFVSQNVLNQLKVKGMDTSLEIHTVTGKKIEKTSIVYGLEVSSVNANENPVNISLPKVYSRQTLPVTVDEIPTPEKLSNWPYLKDVCQHLPSVTDGEIGLLIGGSCPKALEPLEVISSQDDGPFAYKSRLGWCINGPMEATRSKTVCNIIQVRESIDGESHFFSVKEVLKDRSIKNMIIATSSLDFNESDKQASMSVEDCRFLKLMQSNEHKDGHYYLPLPLRSPEKMVPNNRFQALQRANGLKKRLEKDDKMKEDYIKFMNALFENGYARVSDQHPENGKTWYLPHHGVYHPRKPEKIRVVFDCNTKFKDYCINGELIQGPDLTNQLVGVLLRFREEPVAVMADIEAMFHQVRVPERFQNYLRFLWWPEGDFSRDLIDHQMTVHLFGSTSSPSCANFALRRTTTDNRIKFGEEAATVLHRNFYVDDMLKSFKSSSVAVDVFPKVVQMCKERGFRLTKVHSNCRKVLSIIPESERSKALKDLDLSSSPIPSERTLGMKWCAQTDAFTFQITLKDNPLTRRGILSSISSIYDPLGLASQYLLEGKKLLQQICSERCGWDEPLSSVQTFKWQKWKSELTLLEQFKVDRCLRPESFSNIKEISIHHFSDASSDAYGQVSYVRYVNNDSEVSCRLVTSKSRVAPLKRPTIPRLELTAAVVSVKVVMSLRQQLDIPISKEFFWSDSQVVTSRTKVKDSIYLSVIE